MTRYNVQMISTGLFYYGASCQSEEPEWFNAAEAHKIAGTIDREWGRNVTRINAADFSASDCGELAMTTKHTPGPWTYVTDHLCNVSIINAESDGNIPVATVNTTGKLAQTNAKGNAALIAAAPELLAALREILKTADTAGDLNKQRERLMRISGAAIAKVQP